MSFASSNWEDNNQSVRSPNRVWNHSWAKHRWAHFQNITGVENASSVALNVIQKMINETKLHKLQAEAKHYIKLGKQFPKLPSNLPQ